MTKKRQVSDKKTNKKHVWIINDYAGTPTYGPAYRHFSLGKELVKLGYDTTVISSLNSHLFKHKPKPGVENISGIHFLWIKTLDYGYVHSYKRVIKWFVFMAKLFFVPFKIKKPTTIILSPTAPFSILPAWVLSRLFKAKLIYEVRDIWPKTLVDIGNVNKRHPIVLLMRLFEKFALKRADHIVSNLRNYDMYMNENKCNKPFTWISNGIDLDDYNLTNTTSKKLVDLFKQDPNYLEPVTTKLNAKLATNAKTTENASASSAGVAPSKTATDVSIAQKLDGKFTIGYVGSFSASNAISWYLKAISALDKSLPIAFIFLGDGALKEDIINAMKTDDRIMLFKKTTKERAVQVMGACDVVYRGSPNIDLYKYGISPIKNFEYLMSGRPFIHSVSMKNDIVESANAGIVVEAESPNAVCEAITKIYHLPANEQDQLGKNGKKYVMEHFTYKTLAKKYTKIIN